MGKCAFAFLLLMGQSAFATSGIDCQTIDGTLEVFTEEAVVEGDNVVSLGVLAPWFDAKPIVFSKLKNEVNVARDQGVVYMAHNSKGEALTLVMDSAEIAGHPVSTAYLKLDEQIYIETLNCSLGNEG